MFRTGSARSVLARNARSLSPRLYLAAAAHLSSVWVKEYPQSSLPKTS
jgi:hypothetical protein